MSNGIKMSDCRFYVDEDERMIICVIPNTEDMVINFIRDHFSFSDMDFGYLEWRMEDKLLMPKSFVGKAVCSEEDEFDEETGMLIAFARAKDKCYKSFFKRANKFVQTVDGRLGDMIEKFNDLGMKLEVKREAINSEIEEKTGMKMEAEE